MKIKKGDQAAYNAKVKARIPKQRRQTEELHDQSCGHRIGHGSKPDHASRAVTMEEMQRLHKLYGKPDVGLHKTIWDDYEVDKMCILENANFRLLWSSEMPHPLMTELIDQVAKEEEVPTGMVGDLLAEMLGLRPVYSDLTVEDILVSKDWTEPPLSQAEQLTERLHEELADGVQPA